MPQLKNRDLPPPIAEIVGPARVDVPEFGENIFVYVRPLNLIEYRRLFTQAWQWNANFDQSEPDGQAPIKPVEDYDEATLVAAWCTVEKNGDLVFGADRKEAWERVAALSPEYRTAVSRIHMKVLDISGLRSDQANDLIDTAGDTEAGAVGKAGKN